MIGIHRRLTPDTVKQIEKAVESDTESRIANLIHKLQMLHSDPIHFGEQLRAQQYYLWKRIDWKDVFPTVPFKVTVKAKIIQDGISK